MSVLTAKEAAKYLNIHLVTLYNMSAKNIIPGRKVGNIWRFNKATLDKWLSGEYVGPASQGVIPQETNLWHSKSVANIGISGSKSAVLELKDLQKQRALQKQRQSTQG